MRKWMFLGILLFAVVSLALSQQAVQTKPVASSQVPDSIPELAVFDEEVLDSVPWYVSYDVILPFSADSVPTPEWMTIQLVEVGAIDSIQAHQVNKINTNYVRRVKDLAAKKNVSSSVLQSVADAHDDEIKAVLSDEQVPAYEQVKDTLHNRVCYHHCRMCRGMMGH